MVGTVDLEITGAGDKDELSLSGVAAAGSDHLFVVPDEGGSVLRLARHGGGFRLDGTHPVADLVPVAGEPGDEIDLEGLDVAGEELWLAGSHSAVRTRIRKTAPVAAIPRLLATVERPAARRLLARIPLVDTGKGAQPARSATRADGTVQTALSLVPDGLHTALLDDPHLGPFLTLPSKDNGLDIEGIAAVGDQLLLGLRGPVLRGWAVLLTITPRPSDIPGRFAIDPPITHFLDLAGLGVRDLARSGDDLLVLAGPTMLLDGPSRILRIRGAGVRPPARVLRAGDLEQVGPDLAVGVGADHPEGITVLDRPGGPRLLVVYDSPTGSRVHGRTTRAELRALD